MNILNVLYFSPEVGGGIVKHLTVLGRVAKSKGHNLILGFPKIRKWQDELQSNSKVIIIPEIEKPVRSGFPRILREICKMHSVDVVHFHFLFALPFSLALSIPKWSLPIIYHWHSPPKALNMFYNPKSKLIGFLNRFISGTVARITDFRVIDHHITISREITNMLVKNGWTKERKITLLPNGISTAVSNNITLNQKTKSVPIIGAVANFRPEKDHITLIQAFSILYKSGLESELWLVGDGPTRPDVEKLAKELGIESKLRFIGTVSNPDEFYRQFDIFVHSTHFEGHPLVILEAMSFGLPTVATRISSIPEVITDRVNGLLVNPKDPHDLAQALQKILTNKSLYVQLSEAALKTSKEHQSVDEWANNVVSMYEHVLASKSK